MNNWITTPAFVTDRLGMADIGNTIRFITNHTMIPYNAPAITGKRSSKGIWRAATQKTVAAENAIRK